jgi:hypothetical protein
MGRMLMAKHNDMIDGKHRDFCGTKEASCHFMENKMNKRSIPLVVDVACNVIENNFYKVLSQTKSFVHSIKKLTDKPETKYGFVTKTPEWTNFIL